jgi:tripartite-type tricarboxylate transporter receptor subunit TctC
MNKKSRIPLLLIAGLFVGCLLFVTPLAAQDYPKGPVQIVIPYAPGGAGDLLFRIMGDPLSKILKVPVAFVNKGGGGGIVGLSSVVNSKPDGYTLCNANSDTLNVTPLFTKDLPIDTINDVTYIAKVAMFAQGVVVRDESPFKTIEEFIAFAKANPRKLKVGVPGVGSTGHLAVSLFNKDAGVELVPVPFGGGGEVVPALLGGHVDCAFMATMSYKSYYSAGKIRYLAFFSNKRHPVYPNVPTTAEKGLKRTIAEVGMALVGPKGLSTEIVKKWEETIRQVLKDPQVVQAIEKLDFVVDPESGEQFKKEIVDEYAVFKQIAADLNVQK